ncbi:hypothetical protein [Pedococcus bigeumensis]|uniref:hypothetical protein n=1 Tax=Pedococcus bigeumensis TaxID=433644 RepID=UPI002FEC3E2B
MRTTSRVAAALSAAGVAVALGCLPADAAVGTKTMFTVDTQFVDGPSDIVAASGPLSACTQVSDVEGAGDLRTHNQLVFSGVKVLSCGTASVTVGYQAFITLPALQNPAVLPAGGGFKTFGTWWVIDSTLAGVSSGGGTLMGDSRTCTLDPGSDGCITDLFRGTVS